MQTMILAAGLGTRLKPLTDILPKALVPVAGKPLLQHVLDRVASSPSDRVVINTHHHAAQIHNFIDITRGHWPADIRMSDETAALLDTGGGLRHARQLFESDSPVLIYNVDILSDISLRSFYASGDGHAATLLVSRRPTSRYLIFDDTMRLMGWTNIQTHEVRSPLQELACLSGTRLAEDFISPETRTRLHLYAFSGIHTISPSLLALMDGWPERFPVIDFYLSLCATHDIRGVLSPTLRLLDVGKLDTLALADSFLGGL
ncbi:MAG: sugar phosphate nucleotidyltransferase [Prevotella sp.]